MTIDLPAVPPFERLLTAKQVGPMLGLSARAVYDIPEAALPRYRVGAGRGAVRFHSRDVSAYLAACRSARVPATSVGASSSTVSLRAASADLGAMFRAAGVKPRLTHTPGKSRVCTA